MDLDIIIIPCEKILWELGVTLKFGQVKTGLERRKGKGGRRGICLSLIYIIVACSRL